MRRPPPLHRRPRPRCGRSRHVTSIRTMFAAARWVGSRAASSSGAASAGPPATSQNSILARRDKGAGTKAGGPHAPPQRQAPRTPADTHGRSEERACPWPLPRWHRRMSPVPVAQTSCLAPHSPWWDGKFSGPVRARARRPTDRATRPSPVLARVMIFSSASADLTDLAASLRSELPPFTKCWGRSASQILR